MAIVSSSANKKTNNNDFVIRNGFPALRKPDGSPWIDGDEAEPIPAQPFLQSTQSLQIPASLLELWQKDCETVFSARSKEEDAAYSAGVTYFLPCVMKPRCALEALVQSIFRLHVTDATLYRPEQSGAEWWTLVMDDDDDDDDNDKNEAKKKTSTDDDDDEEDEGDEVGMHFDADYGLEDQAPTLLIHPRLATVTYLSDWGAPTVVLHHKSPPPNDMDQLQGEVTQAWVSHPQVGKHIAFDGRLLHGAPATFFPAQNKGKCSDDEPPQKKQKIQSRPPANKKRYTLLVNLWLNHCPLDAEPLDDEIVSQLQVPWQESKESYQWKTTETSSPLKVPLKPSVDDPAGEEETVICSRRVSIYYRSTMKDLHEASLQGSLVELQIEKGTVAIEVGEYVKEEEDDDNEEAKS